MDIMAAQSLVLTSSSLLVVLLLHFSQTSGAISHVCSPSACGIFRNISFPFRLVGDPENCGDHRFELACENNITSFSFNSQKYCVKAINYGNSTIRLVDAFLNNNTICSFPTVSAYSYNDFTCPYAIPIYNSYPYDIKIPIPIHFISCQYRLKNSSLFTEITTHCASNSFNHIARYAYIKVGRMKTSELPHLCGLDLIVMTSWWGLKDLNNVSLSDIHQSLLYGFELYTDSTCVSRTSILWVRVLILVVVLGLLCAGRSPLLTLFVIGAVFTLLFHVPFLSSRLYSVPDIYVVLQPVIVVICATRFILFPLALWLLIYKFRRRHLSIFDAIERFLQSHNRLTPIRYSYSDIKKMTKGFQEKLGEGGYGSVYKGKLRSGHDVAVKLLGKTGGNGQDFMNEIATIGRIHHVNVVKLVGYCAQGSKRALVFDFMSNGSLEKYLFNRENMNFLDWEKKFDITVGVARGIEYLHKGCDIQILHFDIKPHNILLDENFIPKISDFGLAKYFSTEKKNVTLTAARGTIGYVAPELINRSIGAVSYKVDVYSFGMLLIEIVGLKRDLPRNRDDSSKYFPYWIYDQFNQGKDIIIENADENDSTRRVGRKMTIVALWCIQMNPDDRPSMNKVLEMLEGDVEHLQIPKYPSQSIQSIVNADQTGITWSTDSVSLLHNDEVSPSVEITVQE